MVTDISEEIIGQVKSALNISIEIDNIALYKRLNDAYISSHPDKFLNEDNKKIAEERFKMLGVLREKLKDFLEQQRAKGQLVAYDSSNDVAEIEAINCLTEKDLEILRLQRELSRLELSLEDLKIELKSKDKKITDFLTQSTKISKGDLTDIYKPKKKENFLGFSSAIASLSLLIPQVQKLVSSIGIGGFIGSCIIVCITIIWLLEIARNNICNSYIQSIIDKTLYGEDLIEAFGVSYTMDKYSKAYFKEKAVVDYIDNCMNKKKYRLLFYGKYSTIRRQIVEYILLELSRKKVIVDVKTNSMQKVFFVEHRVSIF